MAVTVDAVGPGSTGTHGASPLSWTHTPVGTPTLVIVTVGLMSGGWNPGFGDTLTVTYGGTAMTVVGPVMSNNQTDGGVFLASLPAPASGAQTVVVTWTHSTSAMNCGSISFVGTTSGLDTIVSAFGDNSSGSVPPRATVPNMVSGDIAIDFECYGSGITGAGQNIGTVLWGNDVNGASAAGNAWAQSYTGTGSITVGSNPTTHDWWGLQAVRIIAGGGGSDATATPSTVAAIAGVGTVAMSTGETVSPSTVVGTAGVGAVNAQGGTGVSPSTVVAIAGVGSPSIKTGATATPSTVGAIASIGSAQAQGGIKTLPSTVVAVAGVGSPNINTGSTVTPATVVGAASIPVPSLGGSTTVQPATVAAVASVGAVTMHTGETVSPATVAATASVGSPTMHTGATVSPATVATITSVPTPTVGPPAPPSTNNGQGFIPILLGV